MSEEKLYRNHEARLVKIETQLPEINSKLTDIHRVVCGNGGVGLDEVVRQVADKVNAHLKSHSRWRNRIVSLCAAVLSGTFIAIIVAVITGKI